MQAKTPLRILAVDDDAGIRDLVRSGLGQEGYHVESVSNGVQALDRLAFGRYDAVVLDITMPELDGFGVLKALRNRASPVPVLVMSARHSPDDVVKAISLGAKDYLAKPFSNAQLTGRIARLIRLAAKAAPKPPSDVVHLPID
jgi:two-component system OmpR family response regulator